MSKRIHYMKDRRQVRAAEKQALAKGSEVTQSKMMGHISRRLYGDGSSRVDTDGRGHV